MDIFVARQDYKNAIIIAMELNHPMKILAIFEGLQQKPQDASLLGSEQVQEYISNMDIEQVVKINKVGKAVRIYKRLEHTLKALSNITKTNHIHSFQIQGTNSLGCAQNRWNN
jgi:hypothetical protein